MLFGESQRLIERHLAILTLRESRIAQRPAFLVLALHRMVHDPRPQRHEDVFQPDRQPHPRGETGDGKIPVGGAQPFQVVSQIRIFRRGDPPRIPARPVPFQELEALDNLFRRIPPPALLPTFPQSCPGVCRREAGPEAGRARRLSSTCMGGRSQGRPATCPWPALRETAGLSFPRMNSEVRKSAETRKTATLARSMAASISFSHSTPALIRRSSQTSSSPSLSRTPNCFASRSFHSSSLWL